MNVFYIYSSIIKHLQVSLTVPNQIFLALINSGSTYRKVYILCKKKNTLGVSCRDCVKIMLFVAAFVYEIKWKMFIAYRVLIYY